MSEYAIYLRKSRADAELEATVGGDTLSRHRRTLLELAQRQKLNVTAVYQEVVSGETLAARPEMQKLLTAVDQGAFSGVLVMEVERLARGDTIDQGIVAQSFRCSGTKIITPIKTYDPNDEFDEEYFEFGLFMSRREYKTINRRLQRGRAASVEEGKYCGSVPPYGYRRVRREKGYSLEPVPEQAQWVGRIFSWFVIPQKWTMETSPHPLGCGEIADRLNFLEVPSATGGKWTAPVIRGMLQNPVYAGWVRWKYRPQKKTVENGSVKLSRPRIPEGALLRKGLHPPVVSQELFDRAQQLLGTSRPKQTRVLENPLAGLIFCEKCGHAMVRRQCRSGTLLLCANSDCRGTVAADLQKVEVLILEALRTWLSGLLVQSPENTFACDITIQDVEKTLAQLNVQEVKACELVERGLYSTDLFSARMGTIRERREKLELQLTVLKKRQRQMKGLCARGSEVRYVLDAYDVATPKEKNALLKSVLQRVDYHKTSRERWKGGSDLCLTLYPKLPKTEVSPTEEKGKRIGPSGNGGDHCPPAYQKSL